MWLVNQSVAYHRSRNCCCCCCCCGPLFSPTKSTDDYDCEPGLYHFSSFAVSPFSTSTDDNCLRERAWLCPGGPGNPSRRRSTFIGRGGTGAVAVSDPRPSSAAAVAPARAPAVIVVRPRSTAHQGTAATETGRRHAILHNRLIASTPRR